MPNSFTVAAAQRLCLLHGVYFFKCKADDPDAGRGSEPRRVHVMFMRHPESKGWVGNYYAGPEPDGKLTYEGVLWEINWMLAGHGWPVESKYDKETYIREIEAQGG